MSALNLPGIGNQRIRRLESEYGELSDQINRWKKQIIRVWPDRFSISQLDDAWERAKRQIDEIERIQGRIICQEDPEYPQVFFQLVNPPLLLAIAGQSGLLQRELGIALVGTREPSDGALMRAFQAGAACAAHKRVVVSGLALGCDTQAHWGAIDHGGETIAVLPGPLSRVIPKSNARLARNIVEQGGLLLSENFPGTAVEPYHFVQRNRLLAALSEWVVVVEASRDSGTMHTVRRGSELSRKIAVLGAEQPESLGCQWILRERKGIWIKSVQEIL